MLQLDATFSEKAYGAGSFSDFVEKLKGTGYVKVSGSEGRYIIERISAKAPESHAVKPEEALPLLRDVLETHRLDMENGCLAEDLESWVLTVRSDFSPAAYGFQEFAEFLNYAQDKLVVRVEPDEEKGLLVYLGAEFYPPAQLEEPAAAPEAEVEEPQPYVKGQPSLVPEPEPPKKHRGGRRKAAAPSGHKDGRSPRRRRSSSRHHDTQPVM
jgi:hypothetical protein